MEAKLQALENMLKDTAAAHEKQLSQVQSELAQVHRDLSRVDGELWETKVSMARLERVS